MCSYSQQKNKTISYKPFAIKLVHFQSVIGHPVFIFHLNEKNYLKKFIFQPLFYQQATNKQFPITIHSFFLFLLNNNVLKITVKMINSQITLTI